MLTDQEITDALRKMIGESDTYLLEAYTPDDRAGDMSVYLGLDMTPNPLRLVRFVFPSASAHSLQFHHWPSRAALRSVAPVGELRVVGRPAENARRYLAGADISTTPAVVRYTECAAFAIVNAMNGAVMPYFDGTVNSYQAVCAALIDDSGFWPSLTTLFEFLGLPRGEAVSRLYNFFMFGDRVCSRRDPDWLHAFAHACALAPPALPMRTLCWAVSTDSESAMAVVRYYVERVPLGRAHVTPVWREANDLLARMSGPTVRPVADCELARG